MGSTLLNLLPLVAGAGVVPVLIVMVLLLLSEKQGLLLASMFVAGMTVVRLSQGIVFGLIMGSSNENDGENSQPGTILAILLLVIAVLMFVTAARIGFKQDDPDAPPPKWMAMIQGMTPIKAFGTGAALILLMAKQWVFTLGALATVRDGDLGSMQSVLAFLIFVLLVESFMIVPIAGVAIVPGKAKPMLATMNTWLEAHNDIIVISISLVFGVLFLSKSLSFLI